MATSRPEPNKPGPAIPWLSLLPWFALAVILSFFLRIPFLNVGLISDEGGYAYVTQHWLDGRGTLYDDIWVSRPQGIFVAYAAIMETVGTSTADLRIGAWLFVVATMPAVFAIGRRYAGERAGILAMLIFAVLSASPTIEGFTANAEVFLALPCAWAAWLMLRAQGRNFPWHHLVGIGILTSVATLLKPSGIVMLPIAVLFCLIAGTGGVRAITRHTSWILLGVLIGIAPALIHGWMVGWDNFVFASITYRIDYQSSVTYTWQHHLQNAMGLVQQVLPLLMGSALTIILRRRLAERHATRYLAVSGGSQVRLSWLEQARLLARRSPASVLLWFWIIGCIGGISMGGDWWFHYLIQIAAPFCIWIAPMLIDVCVRLRGVARYAFVAGACMIMLYPFGVAARGDSARITAGIYPNQGYERQGDVGEYLLTHGTPGAPMLVAFDQAALYYLADRPAAYRYMYEQELRAIPNAEQTMVNIVSGPNRPEYVIDTGEPAPFEDGGADFWVAVQQHYRIEAVVNGYKIYRALE